MNDLTILSTLLFNSAQPRQPFSTESIAANREEALVSLDRFGQIDFSRLTEFAVSHHVVVRSLGNLCGLAGAEKDHGRMRQVGDAIASERHRIAHALSVLEAICQQCEVDGHKIVVIKSLDHWPDLGSDLDLYTDADPADILHIMVKNFNARPAERSWGDRLAGKWNFIVPGLLELVEFHVGRLGQTGEQVELARNLVDRAVFTIVNSHRFRIPAPEDRLMISTLQRMYRHFYFRLCDIVDTVHLLEDQAFDFTALRTSAVKAGIWPGTSTYLVIVSDYLTQYRGKGLALPSFVTSATQFAGDAVSFRNGFLRVPIVPHSVRLFVAELAAVAGSRNIRGAARLSILPWLAAAAVVAQKLSGSDKGIW